MNRIVIDNSEVIAWVLDEGSETANRIIGSLAEVHALAPSI